MPTWMWLLLIGGGAYVMLKKPAADTAGMSPEYAAQPALYGVGRVRV